MAISPEYQRTYTTWSSERLVRAASVEMEDYRPEAQEAIRAEIRRRKLTPAEIYRIEQAIWREQDSQPPGIGGWLILFLFMLVTWAVGLVVSILNSSSLYPMSALLTYEAAAVIHLVLAAGCGTVFVALIRRMPEAPRWAGILLSSFGAYYILGSIAVLLTGGKPRVTGLLWLIVWILYFRRSSRVARTYGTNFGA